MNPILIKKLKARLRDFSTNLPFIVSQQVLFMLVSKSTDGPVRSLQVSKMQGIYNTGMFILENKQLSR